MSARKPRICAWARGYGIAFSPRVRLIGRQHDAFFNETRIKCIVTGRDDAHRHHAYHAGDVYWARPSQLYRKRRVARGSGGALIYFDSVLPFEIESFPIVTA